MIFKLKIKEKEYEVEILEEKEGEIKIRVGQKEFLFQEKPQEKDVILGNYLQGKKEFKEKEIKSPIAGKISEIFVQEGEMVRDNQKLLIVSAMKMENEIISESTGKIKKILVKKEQKVKEGEVLIILE